MVILQIWINDIPIDAKKLVCSKVTKQDRELVQVETEFDVTHERYHEITSELYKNDFLIKVPEKNLAFHAEILTYSTSITNLYEKDSVGDFRVTFIEK